MGKWSDCPVLDTVAYSIEQQKLLRQKMEKETKIKKESEKMMKCKAPKSRINSSNRSNKTDSKRLKKMAKDEEQIDIIRSTIRQTQSEKEKNTGEREMNEEEDEKEEEEEAEAEAECSKKENEKKLKLSKGKKKVVLGSKPQIQKRRNILRIDKDFDSQKQNIKKAKSLLNTQMNRRKDLAYDIERSNKKSSSHHSNDKLKEYLTNIKIK